MFFKKDEIFNADGIHQIALNLPINEYYKLFQLMFKNICIFLSESEKLVLDYQTSKSIKDHKNK